MDDPVPFGGYGGRALTAYQRGYRAGHWEGLHGTAPPEPTDSDVERVAEALWESMPGEGKPWTEAADYSKDQIRVWSRAALRAFVSDEQAK